MSFPAYRESALVQCGNYVTLATSATSYHASPGDVVIVNGLDNVQTVTLPLVGTGGPVLVKCVDATHVPKVVTNDSSTIDGGVGATGIELGNGQALEFHSDGATSWFITGGFR